MAVSGNRMATVGQIALAADNNGDGVRGVGTSANRPTLRRSLGLSPVGVVQGGPGYSRLVLRRIGPVTTTQRDDR
jgi:hypothetical protein